MLKLNVGLSRKIGEANYGSRGASVNLELEFDSGLVGDAERLKDRIRQLFTLARNAVEEELDGAAAEPQNGHPGHGHDPNGHGQSPGRSHQNGRRATASQARALIAITEQAGIELGDFLRSRFGVSAPEELSLSQASSLIDELKGKSNGHANGARR